MFLFNILHFIYYISIYPIVMFFKRNGEINQYQYQYQL